MDQIFIYSLPSLFVTHAYNTKGNQHKRYTRCYKQVKEFVNIICSKITFYFKLTIIAISI